MGAPKEHMWLRGAIRGLMLLSALVLAGGVVASPAAGSEWPPADDIQEYRVGFAELAGENLPAEERYLTRVLPLMLYSELEEVPVRRLSAAEREVRGARVLEEERAEGVDDFRAAVRRRDSLLFERDVEADDYRGPEREMADARERLLAIRLFDPSLVAVPQEIPMVFWGEHQESRLLPVADPGEIADEENLDAVVTGSIEYDAGYVIVTIELYESATGQRHRAAYTIARAGDIPDEAPILAREMQPVLMGRGSGHLVVEPSVSSASVQVDGELRGFGRLSLPYLEPGSYEVTVTAPGYRTEERTVVLGEGDEKRVSIELERHDRRTIRVDSEPPGAHLYVGGEWKGRTPLEVELPAGPRRAELRAPGFSTKRFVLDQALPDEVTHTLVGEDKDLGQHFEERRRGFYRSLGWFAASVPVPVLARGAMERYDVFFEGTGQDDRLQQRYNRIRYVELGGYALSGTLLVNTIWQLVRYIRSAEAYHGR